jgi:high-affinity iron transporter
MAGAFLVTLREGLEAALIISIILAYLARTGNRGYFVNVWIGASAAIVVSLAAGAGLYWTVGRLSGRAEEIFEGIAMLIAVAVLTYMVVWMKRQAVNIKAHLEARVGSVVATGSALAMVTLAFIVVVREGIETVLFMLGIVSSTTYSAATIGGFLGLAVAVAVGYAGYKGSRRLNLGVFFNVTGALLIFFAAGLLAHGIHEFQEAGVFPVIVEHVWDTNGFLNEKEGVGNFMRTLFGYNGNPALLEVSLYSAYLALALGYFFGVGRSTGRKLVAPRAGVPARTDDGVEHAEP